jgi:tetratricopeptide (TPR) repeat protein
MELGQIALKNKDYKNSVKIFQYIVDEYPVPPNYQIAKRLVINSREEMVKNTFPVNSDEIRKLINDYSTLLNDFGINNNTIDAMRNKALLYAFYLNKYDSASIILEKIIRLPRINKSVIDRSKLDLGDIYLLMEQPWESTLLYYQVEKSSKDSPIGYEAKLKNARLSYYKGDFALAQSHLDILKLATTREIANDAMSLSLLIKDNTKLDSADKALKRFADIDLLIFQNKKFAALDSLEKLKDDIGEHSLVDEILYREAQLNLEMGNFNESVELLKTLGEKYGDDILGDDALFLLGEIYELHLKNKENAMNTYRDFLVKYPGSNHAAEARKRFRILRGDYL